MVHLDHYYVQQLDHRIFHNQTNTTSMGCVCVLFDVITLRID